MKFSKNVMGVIIKNGGDRMKKGMIKILALIIGAIVAFILIRAAILTIF